MTKDDMTRLHDRMDDLFGVVADIKADVASIRASCPGCTGSIARMKTVIFGPPENGDNPGLIGRVDRLEQVAKAKRWLAAWLVPALIGLIGAIIGGVAQGLFSHS